MTRTQAVTVAEWLARNGYSASVRLAPATVGVPIEFVIEGTASNTGAPALAQLQALMTEISARGLESRVALTVTVSDPLIP